MGYIYTITNKINNKIYVGKTSRDPQIRWKEHLADYRHPELPIQRAFKKYGKDNFIFTIIKEVPDEELNQEEQYYIDLYKSNIYGYNATFGGDGGATHILSQLEIEQIIKLWKDQLTVTEISQITGHCIKSIKYHILQQTGLSEDEYKKQSKINLQRCHSSKKIKPKKNVTMLKPIKNEKQTILPSFTLEQQELIFKLFDLTYSCNYIAKQIGCSYNKMFNFLKLYYSEEEIAYRTTLKTTHSKPYYKYSLEDKLLQIYQNREELKKDFTTSQIKVIQNCARGIKPTAYGFKWSYKLMENNYE